MYVVLRRAAALVERFPVVALLSLLVATLVLGAFATQQEADTDMTAFAPESDLAEAHERIADEFGAAEASVQVLVDAGPDGDVLSPAGLRAAEDVADAARATPELAPLISDPGPEAPGVVTYAQPLEAALAEQGVDAADADEATIDATAAALLEDPATAAQLGGLLSEDLDDGTARAGLIVVQLTGGADDASRAEAELAFRDALLDLDLDGLEIAPFSEAIFGDQILSEMEAEMPILLGLAFLLIIGILFATYRRVGDVVLGLTGLVVTIVWTYGFAVLLGPAYLGITGVMSQISLMIPVLLVGLAIDFAIHLTSRYREELDGGATPARAARGAVLSVGGALVLATITTMVGFLTNVVSPLPPMRDFGIFVAAGVLSAFVVMVVLVPAARALLDRRRAARGTLRPPPVGANRGLGRVMVRAAVLAERRPLVTLAVAGVVTLAAGLAGSQVSTTFSQDDFVPEDSEIGRTLTAMQELFGGDLDETTDVLVDGDLARPAAANALLAVQGRLGERDLVRTTGGQPRASSPATVVLQLAGDPELAPQLAELGVTTEAGFADDADLDRIFALTREVAPQLLAGVLDQEATAARVTISTAAGQEQAEALRDQLLDDVAPLREVGLETTVVSESLLFEQSLDALTDSQVRGIAITLIVALAVLVVFFGVRQRRPMLGLITMLPSALVVAWVAGSMYVLGLSFNVMTAMVASLAIGIGVPYGIHITNRFTEDLARSASVDEAIRETVVHTGGALVGSASTTAAGFGVLAFASLAPMQQFGIITALTIVYSLLAAVLIEPACLKLWADRDRRRHPVTGGTHAHVAPPTSPALADGRGAS